jgi:hypothetical protein
MNLMINGVDDLKSRRAYDLIIQSSSVELSRYRDGTLHWLFRHWIAWRASVGC